MDDKEKVVNRLIGCECENDHKICGVDCPDDGVMLCSRDIHHKGKHFACGASGAHNMYEW